MTQLTILYVDDNRTNLELIHRMLQRKGYTPYVTQDPREGLRMASTLQPDVILLDIQMPEMSGYTMLERLRDGIVPMQTPIIALTANAMPGDKSIALAAGFTDYLTKPVYRVTLYNMIEEYTANTASTA